MCVGQWCTAQWIEPCTQPSPSLCVASFVRDHMHHHLISTKRCSSRPQKHPRDSSPHSAMIVTSEPGGLVGSLAAMAWLKRKAKMVKQRVKIFGFYLKHFTISFLQFPPVPDGVRHFCGRTIMIPNVWAVLSLRIQLPDTQQPSQEPSNIFTDSANAGLVTTLKKKHFLMWRGTGRVLI